MEWNEIFYILQWNAVCMHLMEGWLNFENYLTVILTIFTEHNVKIPFIKVTIMQFKNNKTTGSDELFAEWFGR